MWSHPSVRWMWIYRQTITKLVFPAQFIVHCVQFPSLTTLAEFALIFRPVQRLLKCTAIRMLHLCFFGCCGSERSYYKPGIKFSCSQPLFQLNTAWHQFVGFAVKRDPLCLLPEHKFTDTDTDGKCLLLWTNSSHKLVISSIYVSLYSSSDSQIRYCVD